MVLPAVTPPMPSREGDAVELVRGSERCADEACGQPASVLVAESCVDQDRADEGRDVEGALAVAVGTAATDGVLLVPAVEDERQPVAPACGGMDIGTSRSGEAL